MDFWQHLNASKALDLQGITEGLAGHFAQLMARGHSIADLLAHFADDFGHLPAERLRQLANAHRLWKLWRKRRQQLEQARSKAKLPTLPEDVFADAPEPHQLDAAVRTARLCPRQEVKTDREWTGVLRAGVELWTRCIALTRKGGRVSSDAKQVDDPRAAEYDSYLRYTDDLEKLAPHRWLAMRRGQRAGVLELKLELPTEEMLNEVIQMTGRLGPPAASREPASLLQELILDDLEPWLLRILDSDAQTKAVNAATENLAGLLRSQPVQARQLAAAYLTKPGAMAAAVVVEREGDVLAQKALRAEGSWIEKLVDFLQGQETQTQQVVLPTSVPADSLLASLEERLSSAGFHVIRVRVAALAEARRPLTDPPHRLGSTVASAVVLARRALDPLKEWSAVDPVSIGIAEYQNDLDEDALRAALTDTVELCLLERRRGKRVSMGGAISRSSTAMARLNPLVKTLNDLRPGMSVHGVVTNISHFGAFVNIGLPQEALVHISELSDQFVSNPNEVVSIGQQVTAQVLAVDPSRGRISLSLKNPARLQQERERDRDRQRPKALPPMSKAQALANLEKLFKK